MGERKGADRDDAFLLKLAHSAATCRHRLTALRRRSKPKTTEATRCSGMSAGNASLTEATRSVAVSWIFLQHVPYRPVLEPRLSGSLLEMARHDFMTW